MLVNKSMFPVRVGFNSISRMQEQLGKLQTQVGSGQKASTLAEMGSDRTVSLAVRSRLSKLDGYSENITTVNLRLSVLGQAFTSLSEIKSDANTSATPSSYGTGGITTTTLRQDSEARLAMVLDVLNSNVGGRYLMGGNSTQDQPVADVADMLDGKGGAAGFRTVASERNRADLGGDTGDTLANLDLPEVTIGSTRQNTVVLSSRLLDTYGYKLSSITGSTPEITTAGPTTSPLSPAAQFAAQPANGDPVTVTLKNTGGVTRTVNLTAVNTLSVPPVAGEYVISTTSAEDTAANFQTALEGLVGNLDSYPQITSSDPDIKIVGQTESAEALSMKFAAQPADGQQISIGIKGPDGATQTITFTAKTALTVLPATPDPNEYLIGGTVKDTARNLQAAISEAMGGLAAPLKLGRLEASTPAVPGNETTLTEQVPATEFGYKLSTLSATSDKINVSSTAGVPATMTVRFMGQPKAGEGVTIGLKMPDGTEEQIKLQAVAGNPVAGQFRIGATKEETAANFEAALKVKLDQTSKTKLLAASTYAAADNFFNSGGVPVKRVDGNPETATSLRSATAADTVLWYTGQQTGDARTSASAKIDDSTTVNYGVRANENGLVELVRTLASMAVQDYPADDPYAKDIFSGMVERQQQNLAGATDVQAGSVKVIAVELGTVKATVGAVSQRHVDYAYQLENMLTDAETVSLEETSMNLLTVKTRLEASYQTIASISQLSLVNYIK